MTTDDQKLLKGIREKLKDVGEDIADAFKRGYTIEFNINLHTGEVADFVVKGKVDIDSMLN